MNAFAMIEFASVALGLSSVVWVLGIQAIGLLRSMPRPRFLALQMTLVRVWSRALAVITAVAAALALLRAGPHAWPVLGALVGAVVSGYGAVPRALRAGAAAIKADHGEAMTSAGFLSEGGGDQTRVWHRVVLVCVVVVVAGLGWDARALLRLPHDAAEATALARP